MLRVLKLLWKSLAEYYYDIVSLTWINLLWLVTSLVPILGSLGLAQATGALYLAPLAIVGIVLAPPGLGALMYTMNQFNLGESVDRHTYFGGFRRYFGLSWAVAATDAVLGGLLVANCLFYLTRSSAAFKLIGIIWIYGLVFWLCLQWYLWPLMVEQEKKKLLLFYRNSALLVLDNLGFSMSLAVVMLIFVALSFLLGLPALILVGSVTALVATKALASLLAKYDQKPEAAATEPTVEQALNAPRVHYGRPVDDASAGSAKDR